MAGVDVGTAYLTVVPSAKGFAGKLQSELGGGMAAAGSKAGETASKGFSSTFKAGIGTAAKAGALVLAGAAAVGIGFVRDSIAEARESQKVGALTANVIKATGGAAKVSADQVGDLATAISNKTGIDDEAIQSGANMLLTFKNIRNEAGKGNDIFNQSTGILTDLATAMGSDPQKAAIQLGKALNDPVKGISALSRVGVTFDEQQKKQIETLVKSGDTAGAQKIILKELGSEFGGAAEASATAGEKMATAFGNFKEGIGTSLLPVLDKVEGFVTNKLLPGIQGLIDLLFKGDFTSAFGKAFDINEDDGIVAFLFDVRDGAIKLGHALATAARWIKNDAIPAVVKFAGWIKNDLWPAIQDGYKTIMPGLKQAFEIVAGAFKSTGGEGSTFGEKLKMIGEVITTKVIPFIALLVKVWLPYIATQIRIVIEVVKAVYGVFITWRNVMATVTAFILEKFAAVARAGANMLDALSNVPGFGWAKDAADKLRNAANKAAGLGKAIGDIPKNVDVKVNFKATSGRIRVGGESVNVGMRASGGPVTAGRPYIVGENEPELFVPKQSGTILNQSQMAGMGGGRMDPFVFAEAVASAMQRTPLSVGVTETTRAVSRRQNARAAIG